MDDARITDVIQKVFLETFPSELHPESFDFGKQQSTFQNWDSFSHMELVSKIESELAVSLDMDEIISVRSPQDFVDLVKRKMAI